VWPSAATGNHNNDEHNDDDNDDDTGIHDDNRAARNHNHHTGADYHATTGRDHDDRSAAGGWGVCRRWQHRRYRHYPRRGVGGCRYHGAGHGAGTGVPWSAAELTAELIDTSGGDKVPPWSPLTGDFIYDPDHDVVTVDAVCHWRSDGGSRRLPVTGSAYVPIWADGISTRTESTEADSRHPSFFPGADIQAVRSGHTLDRRICHPRPLGGVHGLRLHLRLVPDMDGEPEVEYRVEMIRLPGRDPYTSVGRRVGWYRPGAVHGVVGREVPRLV
jgi:hypothetical protein